MLLRAEGDAFSAGADVSTFAGLDRDGATALMTDALSLPGPSGYWSSSGMALGIAALGTLIPSGGLSAHPQAFVNGFRQAMLAATIIAAAGAAGTAMLLIPDRSPGPISHTVEHELAQLAGER